MALPEKAARLASLSASEQVCKNKEKKINKRQSEKKIIFLMQRFKLLGLPGGRGKRGQCLRMKHHIPWRVQLR
jgi:hypothetical protein